MALHVDEVGKNAMGGTELQAAYLEKYVDKDLLDKFQIVISRARDLQDKPRLFWVKDLHSDPEVQKLKDPNFLNQFEYVIHNSDFQRAMYHAYLGVPWEKQHVLKNAIEPDQTVDIFKKLYPKKVKLIYSSTPQRGLNILYAVFDKLYKEDKDIELNVYSSFDIYGHYERNKPYLPLFEMCKNHPGINYFGSVSHSEVLKAMQENHIMAYPCIWEETSCITALENASAGNLIVTNNLGALPETTAGFAMMYDYTDDIQEHANRFYTVLKDAINKVRNREAGPIKGMTMSTLILEQKNYADKFYNWDLRGEEWTDFLTKISK